MGWFNHQLDKDLIAGFIKGNHKLIGPQNDL